MAEAAALLRGRYGMDVTIRFNSDRRSGGAWLVTHAVDAVRANSEIGIRAALLPRMAVPADLAARKTEVSAGISRLAGRVEALLADPAATRAQVWEPKREIQAMQRRLHDLETRGAEQDGERLAVFAYVGTRSLASAGVATDIADDPERRYANVEVAGPADAIAFLDRAAVLLDSYNAAADEPPAPRRR